MSESLDFRVIAPLTLVIRCTSPPQNFDTHSCHRTSRYTENLVHLLDSKTLWTEYGIDDDIVVRLSCVRHLSLCGADATICYLQPFTSDFPCADIYEMISLDLLHQLIKGVFKDHLVTWVCKYLIAEHGEREAKVILDDIDQRYVVATLAHF